MLGAQVAPDHHASHQREVERRDQVGGRPRVEILEGAAIHLGALVEQVDGTDARRQRTERVLPPSELAVERVVERERHRSTADVEQASRGVVPGRDRGAPDPEPLRQREHLRVRRVDELRPALAPLAVREVVAPHPATDAIARFEHHHLAPGGDEVGRGAETGEACADHDDIDALLRCRGGHRPRSRSMRRRSRFVGRPVPRSRCGAGASSIGGGGGLWSTMQSIATFAPTRLSTSRTTS